MRSEGARYSFDRPDIWVIAVFDLDVDTVVLFVERFYIAFDVGEDLVESVSVSGDLPSQEVFQIM